MRILVQRSVYDQVVERMALRYDALKVGRAMDDLDVGPLISAKQKSIVSGFIDKGADLLSRVLVGQGDIISAEPARRIRSMGEEAARHSGLDKDVLLEKLARQIPLKFVGEPNDIANAVVYLASDESRFMTGAELKLDGGISAM